MDLSTAVDRLDDLARDALAWLPGILMGLLVLGIFLLVSRGVQAGVARAVMYRSESRGLARVLARLARGFVILVGLLVGAAFAFPSISAADLFGVLGVGGVAIGFAFRDILQNMLAGILLLLTRPFRLGDQIKAGEFEGTVEDIQIRATTIRTYDNRRAVIPNSDLFSGKVLVNTAYDKRRVTLEIGIGNGDDIALAKRVILGVARATEGVLGEPAPKVRVVGFGDFSVKLQLLFWVDPPMRVEVLDVADRVLEAVKPALTDAGVDLPFPTQQILFHDQTEATDGDRGRQREGWPARPGGGNPLPRVAALRREGEPAVPRGGGDGAG